MGFKEVPEVNDALAVYTVIMGDGYVLPQVEPDTGVEFLCFTDQAEIKGNGWTVVVCKPLLPADLPRSSREQKIRPHLWLQGYQKSIYIDPSVKLTTSALQLWTYLVPDDATQLGCFRHSYRDTLDGEFSVVLQGRLDHAHVLQEQRSAMDHSYRALLFERPLWGGVIARRHMEPDCVRAMELWFIYVMRYSRRDQLSMPLILSEIPAKAVNLRSDDIKHSSFHEWPVHGYERPGRYYLGYEKKGFRGKLSRAMKRVRSWKA